MAEMLCEQKKYDDALQYAKDARKIANDLSLKKISDNTYDALVAEYAMLCCEIHFCKKETGRGLAYYAETFFYSDWGTDDADFRRRWITMWLLPASIMQNKSKNSAALAVQMSDTAQVLYDESGSAFDKEQLLKCLLYAIQYQESAEGRQPLLDRALALADTMQLSHLSEAVQLQVAQAYVYGAACAQTVPEHSALIQKALDIALSHPHSIKAREYASVVYFTKYAYFKNAGQCTQADLCLERAVALMRDIANETAIADDYESLFKLEYMQLPEHMQSAASYLQFQLEKWEAAHKEHPESKAIRKAYRARRRTWRWRWIVLPFVTRRAKKKNAE
jgi:hypothetical protein